MTHTILKSNARSLLPACTLLLALLVVLLGTGSMSLAQVRNPLIRVCTVNGGLYEVHPVQRGSVMDEVAFCRFDSVTVIDSQSLVSNLENITTEAVRSVVNDVLAVDCEASGATGHLELDSATNLCVFADGSMISSGFLSSPIGGSSRGLLKSVLENR